MNLREPEKQILDDFEHKVANKIEKYGANADFPKFENYGITRMDLDDYLFDKQAILDMGGSKRTQLTVGGFITVIPVLILSCFPDKSPIYENGKAITTVIAIIIGLPLGVILWATDKDGLHPNKGVNTVLGFIVNFFRSIPAVIRALDGFRIGEQHVHRHAAGQDHFGNDGLLRILAGNDLMQDIRCFCGRGFDVGQALAVNQRRDF